MKSLPVILLLSGAMIAFMVFAAGAPGCVSLRAKRPIQVTSVLLIPPLSATIETVQIALKNVSGEPVVSLRATLMKGTEAFDATFDVTPSNPLSTGGIATQNLSLVGARFSVNETYPLTVHVTLQDETKYVYTVNVRIISRLYNSTTKPPSG